MSSLPDLDQGNNDFQSDDDEHSDTASAPSTPNIVYRDDYSPMSGREHWAHTYRRLQPFDLEQDKAVAMRACQNFRDDLPARVSLSNLPTEILYDIAKCACIMFHFRTTCRKDKILVAEKVYTHPGIFNFRLLGTRYATIGGHVFARFADDIDADMQYEGLLTHQSGWQRIKRLSDSAIFSSLVHKLTIYTGKLRFPRTDDLDTSPIRSSQATEVEEALAKFTNLYKATIEFGPEVPEMPEDGSGDSYGVVLTPMLCKLDSLRGLVMSKILDAQWYLDEAQMSSFFVNGVSSNITWLVARSPELTVRPTEPYDQKSHNVLWLMPRLEDLVFETEWGGRALPRAPLGCVIRPSYCPLLKVLVLEGRFTSTSANVVDLINAHPCLTVLDIMSLELDTTEWQPIEDAIMQLPSLLEAHILGRHNCATDYVPVRIYMNPPDLVIGWTDRDCSACQYIRQRDTLFIQHFHMVLHRDWMWCKY